MKTTIARVKAMSLAVIALGALSASAEIKYWDNPAYKAFDVGDYVQDGLLLHYDGIRNAGATAGHDPNATVWKNLGSGGAAYDMERYSLVDNAPVVNSTAKGQWRENGFYFDKSALFHTVSSNAFTVGVRYTLQTLLDATAEDQNGIGYLMCPLVAVNENDWLRFSLAIRNTSYSYGGVSIASSMYHCAFDNAGETRVALPGESFTYATTMLNGNEAVIFSGTKAVWNGTPSAGYMTDPAKTPKARTYSKGFSIGGQSPNTQLFKGVLKCYRHYDRVLNDDELAWNRVVDEARFFGRVVALPVTNVVVASNIPIAFGEEPIGCYAVNVTHDFSAPASKVIKGRTYTLDGYTVETWDGEKWGVAQEVAAGSGDFISYTAADNALVRLTWKWTAGDGLVNYDAEDYVQNGLVMNYDGIRNAGLEAPHDPAATVWKNLGNGGATYDMERYSLVDGTLVINSAAKGTWSGNGFCFDKSALFHICNSNSITVGVTYTLQTLINATSADQTVGDSHIGYLMCPLVAANKDDWLRFSLAIRNNAFSYGGVSVAKSMYHCAYDNAGDQRAALPGTSFSYATAMLNGNEAVIFSGTKAVWSGSPSTGYLTDPNKTPKARTYPKGLSIGGQSPSTQFFKGMLHSYRHYDRVLNDDELVWNRVVDNARFFPVTNVVVATTRTGVFGNEKDGAYQVANAYTFTAPESVTVGKFTYAPTGYAVQVWDEANGVWGKATEYTGSSYAYTTSVGKVRLLWRWKVVKGIRTLADYDVTDYVAGGLTFHLDGIRNAGATLAHAEKPEIWANLGTGGTDANIREGDKERVVNWTDKGYFFDGNTRFFATLPYTTTFTLQLYTDAIQNEQHNPSSAHILPFQMGYHDFSVSVYNTKLYFRTQGEESLWSTLSLNIDKTKPWGYVTAVLDDATRSASVFSGIKYSDGASKTFETMAKPTLSGLTLGGGGSSSSQYLKGTLYYYRYYDRVLSEEELAWNREVDEARYFGRLPQTNVVICTKYANRGEGAEVLAEQSGSYLVEGEWKFSSTSVKDSRGRVKPVAGYYLETLVDGVWADKTWHDGSEYIYSAATAGGAVVRITWCTSPEGLTIMVR